VSSDSQGSVLLPLFIKVRRLISDELPANDNMIALDIIVLVLNGHYAGKSIQIKALVMSLPHSKTGIRYHCKKLIDDGWISKKYNGTDKRVKILVPTDKLMERCSSFLEKLLALSQASSLSNG
jgi:hypothetical protein